MRAWAGMEEGEAAHTLMQEDDAATASTGTGTGGTQAMVYIPVPRGQLTRLLFSNPVCFLVTPNSGSSGGGSWNVMAVSWLSPVDNHCLFTLSLHAGRHTVDNLRRSPYFTLCPAAATQREALLAVGGTSGKEEGGSKAERVGVPLVSPGHGCLEGALATLLGVKGTKRGGGDTATSTPPSAVPPPVSSSGLLWRGVQGAPAHACCRVVHCLAGPAWPGRETGDDAARGHVILLCEILCAAVQPQYWDGKCFAAPPGSQAPPLLSFMGSKRFAHIVPQSP